MKWLPNILTVARVVMTIMFIVFFLRLNIIVAFVLFVLASATDYYDGYLARRYQVITSFGKIADPIADKFLILSAFYVFSFLDIVPGWIFVVIAVREIGVTLFRFWAMSKGRVLAAEKAGKLKTVFQIVTICLMMVFQMAAVYGGEEFFTSFSGIRSVLIISIIVALGFTVAITLISGFFVFWNNRGLLFKQEGVNA